MELLTPGNQQIPQIRFGVFVVALLMVKTYKNDGEPVNIRFNLKNIFYAVNTQNLEEIYSPYSQLWNSASHSHK